MADKRFIKGLFKDTAHIDQPEGSWRYALNAFLNQNDGAISNESGNEIDGVIAVPEYAQGNVEFYLVVGEIGIDNDRTILFLKDSRPPTAGFTPYSAIGVFDPSGTTSDGYINKFKMLLELDVNNITTPFTSKNLDLNFSLNKRIEGTFKVDSRNNTIIYWTDDLNPPRTLNVTRQEANTANPITSTIYGTNIVFSTNRYYIEQLNLFPHSGQTPHITLQETIDLNNPVGNFQRSVKEGGGLLTGVYYLGLAYVDEDFVATNFVVVSNPVSIVDEFDHTRPTYKKDGAKDGVQTSKSIRWNVSNLNSDYPYVRPVVIRKMGDAIDAYRLNDLDNQIVLAEGIMFSGVEGYAKASIDDVIIDTVSYEKAKTINQLDGILYLGNLASKEDLGFQKYANNIKVNSTVKLIEPFDEMHYRVDMLETGYLNSPVDGGSIVDDTKSYRYQPNIFNYKGYKRDEVYALYIAFILNDGSMSYAYHIPGRTSENIDWYGDSNYTGGSGLPAGIHNEAASHSPGDFRELSPSDAKLFHFYDSSIVNQGSNTNSAGTSRHMNFWHNRTEFYPDTDNYITHNRNGVVAGGDLRGLRVRHNHFPSNENAARSSITQVTNHHEEVNTDSFTAPTFGGWQGVFGYRQSSSGGGTARIAAASCNETCDCSLQSLRFDNSLISETSGSINSNAFTTELNATALAYSGGSPLGYVDQDAWAAAAAANFIPPQDLAFDAGGNACTGSGGGPWESYNHRFVATEANTTVFVNWRLSFNQTQGQSEGAYAGLRSSIGGVRTPSWYDYVTTNSATSAYSSSSTGGSAGDCLSPAGGVSRHGLTGWMEFNLVNVGDYVELWSHFQPSGSSEFAVNSNAGHMLWDVQAPTASSFNLNNVKVSHQVRALGFDLEDIHIPRSIADKVQGFRVYYAKREHSDKTCLDQSVVIPQQRESGILGLCAEAQQAGSAGAQAMQSLLNTPESFYTNSAYALDPIVYPFGYEQISFYGFNLLRSKDSIAPATHIKVQYGVYDYVWNGGDIEQEKQNFTELVAPQPGEPLESTEVWTNDSVQNCYAPAVLSALFVGRNYVTTRLFSRTYNLNRILGQKAKSYVNGDSIFNGQALGLAKILNLYGDSHIALGLKDGHELPALSTRQAGNYGFAPAAGAPCILQNNLGYFDFDNQNGHLTDAGVGSSNGPGTSTNQNIHESYIVDLKAFKSDVYKSIDSQELIWTGFEVLHQEMENFIFEDADGSMTGSGHTADLNGYLDDGNGSPIAGADNLGVNNDYDGIFGGDIFICRYGIVKSVSPLHSNSNSNAQRAIYEHIVESVDNINFRHAESDESLYFPTANFRDLITKGGKQDYMSQDNLKYNKNYSEVNDLRTAIPLPVKDPNQIDFPTRTHRSAKNDTTSLIDNYRLFLANQFKDLPRNRGELWKLASFSNLLYFHMEDSLFKAKGKQSLQMKDGSESFVGSGDIFQQDPDEVVQTGGGYGGTQSQFAAITTKAGYFFVDKDSRKVFLMRDQLTEISGNGMESWFREYIPLALESYKLQNATDNPLAGIGFHSVYDPKYKRILLTKRDIAPTQDFIDLWIGNTAEGSFGWNNGLIDYDDETGQYFIYDVAMSGTTYEYIDFQDTTYFSKSGWTISYFPELNIWVSFHNYIPYIYLKDSTDYYSITDKYLPYVNGEVSNTGAYANNVSLYGNAGIWKHHAGKKGVYYEDLSTNENPHYFELEFIHNDSKTLDKVHSSFDFTIQTFKYNSDTNLYDLNVLEHGFDSYIVYNTHQVDQNHLFYFINTRRVGNEWKINQFRDMAATSVNVDPYYTNAAPNIIGGVNTGTLTTLHDQKMFIPQYLPATLFESHYTESLNTIGYMNFAKPWNERRKFVDKWLGIRLSCSNSDNKLLNLYATNVASRKFYR